MHHLSGLRASLQRLSSSLEIFPPHQSESFFKDESGISSIPSHACLQTVAEAQLTTLRKLSVCGCRMSIHLRV